MLNREHTHTRLVGFDSLLVTKAERFVLMNETNSNPKAHFIFSVILLFRKKLIIGFFLYFNYN